jgi:hypothetical protein
MGSSLLLSTVKKPLKGIGVLQTFFAKWFGFMETA